MRINIPEQAKYWIWKSSYNVSLKQCPRTTVHLYLAPDQYCSRLAWCSLIPVRRWPKSNLNGKPAINVCGSLMAQFLKGTLIHLTKQVWKQESNLLNVRRRSKCWSTFCNNIINMRSTFGPLGSGRLPGTAGDQIPAHNFTCQCKVPAHNFTAHVVGYGK